MDATFSTSATWIEYEDIDALRCDGFVEYCYETNGIRIFGNNSYWDISKAAATNISHHASVIPSHQAKYYMTLVKETY